jgi:ammonium transporter, Amt family
MMKNLLDACGTAVAFYTCGYGLAYGASTSRTKTFIGINSFFLRGDNIDFSDFFFQCAFASTAVTIVASALAERCTMTAYLFYSVILAGFVYPVVAHAVWTNKGYLTNLFDDGTSMIDFAGRYGRQIILHTKQYMRNLTTLSRSGVVHITGGMTALIASIILGPRKGRFYETSDGKPRTSSTFKGDSVSLQMLGTMILWFGWYGFNCGSALAVPTNEKANVAGLVAATTTLSGACGCLSALFINGLWFFYNEGHFPLDIEAAMNGVLSGLVAVTAGCGVVEPASAIFIGVVAGGLFLGSKHLLSRWRIDDAVDAIPVHLVNGSWGVFATGLLASPTRLLAAYGSDANGGWFYSLSNVNKLLAAQVIGMLSILLWVTATMLPFFKLLDAGGCFRVSELDELIGLGTWSQALVIWHQPGQTFSPEWIFLFQMPHTQVAKFQPDCLTIIRRHRIKRKDLMPFRNDLKTA